MAQKRKSRRGKRVLQMSSKINIDLPASEIPDEKDVSERIMDKWSGSRSGAWASRGFDFQHTVATWIAARLIAGDLRADALVPEGLEDISIESETSRHVQVKSRGEHLGAFPVGTASNHIVDSWLRHRERGTNSDKLTVVLERGITGESGLGEFDTPLIDSLAQDSTLRDRIATAAKKRGLSDGDLHELLVQTSVYAVSWAAIDKDSRSLLGSAYKKVSPAVLNYLARDLRVVVAETASLNAQVDKYADRHALNRSELTKLSHHFIEQLDLSGLERALVLGLCTPLSFTDELPDVRFYEGVSTQPGHIVAGLVVPRADLIGEAVTGVQETSSVILTGPSGVGKSAVLWSIPLAVPGVLWFRVNRLSATDVSEVLRLCRSHRVSEANPIGLLIDAAGSGEFSGWSQLREQVSAMPGLFMISTARHEDLISLGDLSGCRTITVALNEEAAEAIFNGLRDRNATKALHWREAFEQTDGLTLEFTHLLTRGERLSSIITEQIRRRITERRNVELDLLSLCATADRWSASLAVETAAEVCGVSTLELREPLERLAEELLLVERNGSISGVHQLRSAAISQAIHTQPPPRLEHTVRRLLPALAPADVRRFIPNALRDKPDLDPIVREVAVREQNDIVKLTAYLRGLRIFDFYERAVKWVDIAERHEIPASQQPLAQLLAIQGILQLNTTPQVFRHAVTEMAATRESSRGLAVTLEMGYQRIAKLLAETSDGDVANALMFELLGSNSEFASECQSALSPCSPLIETMRRASAKQVGSILATANSLSSGLAQSLVNLCGGESALSAKVRQAEPWIVDFHIDDSGDETVAKARVLHVADAVNGDPHDRVVALGRLLLRCFPRTSHVDVKVVLPGGHEYRFGEHELGSTSLRREYDHSELEVAWNQERIQVTNAVLGATDTDRLTIALPMLESLAEILRVFGNAYTAAATRYTDLNRLAAKINGLGEAAKKIPPRLSGPRLALGLQQEVKLARFVRDPLSDLITDLTDNIFPRLLKSEAPAGVAAHLCDNVIANSLKGAQQEPWHLVGFDAFPECLATLESDLECLLAIMAAVAEDPTAALALGRAARAGRHQGALSRAAESAKSRTKRVLTGRKTELERLGQSTGRTLHVYGNHHDRYQAVPEWLVSVELSSLLDWGEAMEDIGTILLGSKRPQEKLIIVPFRNGQPVETCTISLVYTFIPIGELGQWRSVTPPPHETPLTDSFDSAIQALQIISGTLTLLESQQEDRSVKSAMEKAKQDLVRSRRSILQMPSDAITNQIVLLITTFEELVASEENGGRVGGSFAGELFGAATLGQQTRMTVTLDTARLAALEWDIDRDSALDDPAPAAGSEMT